MLTPLDIENKKFSKQMMNGYSVNEVDEFLDELTADYEKLYKETTDSKNKIADMQEEMAKYKNIESTLNNTLIMAQTAAEDVKNLAKQQADNILSEAQANAKQAVTELEQEIALKQKELEDLQKQFDVYKAKMESLLISQLELLKEIIISNNDLSVQEHSQLEKMITIDDKYYLFGLNQIRVYRLKDKKLSIVQTINISE